MSLYLQDTCPNKGNFYSIPRVSAKDRFYCSKLILWSIYFSDRLKTFKTRMSNNVLLYTYNEFTQKPWVIQGVVFVMSTEHQPL